MPIVICDVSGIYPDDEGAILDDNYGIAIRTGLHCAPLLHADLGTANREAIRFSLGFNSTESDIESAIEAMAEIGGKARR